MTPNRQHDTGNTNTNANTTPNTVTTVTLKFHPETWETHYGEQYAVPTGDPITFTVPVTAVTHNGDFIPEATREMDSLKHHPNAPESVQNWEGPFEITYHELDSNEPGSVNTEELLSESTAHVTFHPQIPLGRSATLTTIEDTWTFTVPAVDALTDSNTSVRERDTEASDHLAHHDNAPEIVQRWCELTDWYFYISVDSFETPIGTLEPREFITVITTTEGDSDE